jgi:hypothetical protein
MNTDLDRFYQVIVSDPVLVKELEFISDQHDLVSGIVRLGEQKECVFTEADVKTSIELNTAQGQGNYVCLPIGCWSTIAVA